MALERGSHEVWLCVVPLDNCFWSTVPRHIHQWEPLLSRLQQTPRGGADADKHEVHGGGMELLTKGGVKSGDYGHVVALWSDTKGRFTSTPCNAPARGARSDT